MENLDFNIYAYEAPTSKAEYLSLAQEALRVVNEISDFISGRERELEIYASSRAECN